MASESKPANDMAPAGSVSNRGKDGWWKNTVESRRKLEVIFQMIGGSGEDDATISEPELAHMLRNLGEACDEQMVSGMLASVDNNGDFELDFDEFFSVMTNTAPPKQAKAGSGTSPDRVPALSRHRSQLELETSTCGISLEEIHTLFNEIDVDGSGDLDKWEVRQLASKLNRRMKRRHLIDAMKVMDPQDTGSVNFDMFAQWLFDADHHWSDLIVLPEGQILAIRRLLHAYEASHPLESVESEGLVHGEETTSASSTSEHWHLKRWKRLAIMLDFMDQTTATWGEPRKQIGQNRPGDGVDLRVLVSAQEAEGEAKAKRCFLRPESPFRAGWDITQVLLLLYVLISVPFRLAFGVEAPCGTPGFWIDVGVDVYFLVDIAMNFRTGIYTLHGVLEVNTKEIAFAYFKGWFSVDVLSCLPVSYVMLLVEGCSDGGSSGGSSTRMIKLLRLLKLGKLLRVARLVRLLERYEEVLRPVLAGFGSFLLCIVIFIFAHIVACLWYYTGTYNSQEEYQEPVYGWVERTYPSCGPDENNFVVYNESVCVEHGDGTRYITAVYWAMMTLSTVSRLNADRNFDSNFAATLAVLMELCMQVGYGDYTAHTDAEKLFTNGMMCFGALVFAAISGMLASSMMTKKGAEQVYNTRMDDIYHFLRDKKVPTSITRRVTAYFRTLWSEKHVYDDKQILASMPAHVSGPIIEFLYMATLKNVPLFSGLHERDQDGRSSISGRLILQRIGMGLQHEVALPNDVLMAEGNVGCQMFILTQGEVDIYAASTRQGGGRSCDGGTGHAPTERRETGTELEALKAEHEWDASPRSVMAAVHATISPTSRLGRIGDGCFFGELALMRLDMGLQVRQRTVVARTTCVLAILQKSVLDELRNEFCDLDLSLSRIEQSLGADRSTPKPDAEIAEHMRCMQRRIDGHFERLDRSLQQRMDKQDAKIDRLLRTLSTGHGEGGAGGAADNESGEILLSF